MIETIRQLPIEIITAIIALSAAIVASLITIFGVWLGNRHNQKLQKNVLEHQSRENNLDRKMELRKNIYLETSEQLTVAIQHLTTLNLINFSDQNPSEKLNQFLIAANKALLVATDDTVDKINNLLFSLMKTFFLLVKEAQPYQDVLIERDIQQANYDNYNAERSRILASMTQFNEEAKVDSAIWNALSRNLDYVSKSAEDAHQKRADADESLLNLNRQFSKISFMEIKKLSEVSLPAMVALRSEMKISSDIEHYRESLQKRFSQTEEMIDELWDHLEGS